MFKEMSLKAQDFSALAQDKFLWKHYFMGYGSISLTWPCETHT